MLAMMYCLVSIAYIGGNQLPNQPNDYIIMTDSINQLKAAYIHIYQRFDDNGGEYEQIAATTRPDGGGPIVRVMLGFLEVGQYGQDALKIIAKEWGSVEGFCDTEFALGSYVPSSLTLS
jgi:hypothetical protein